MNEKQITFAPHGHLLTNAGVWSPDGHRIVYDVRSNHDGSIFDGTRIETVDVFTGEIRVLYESSRGACCGVASYSPVQNTVVFILGPENPTSDWQYGFHRRQGVLVNESRPGVAINLDARDLISPFTPGALRGGTHLHLFSPDGRMVVSTYHDLPMLPVEDHRNICVSIVGHPVAVPKSHERNHDGCAFSVLVTRTMSNPKQGSDDISRACEEAWVGDSGGMIAFAGEVVSAKGKRQLEVFVVDLPSDLMIAGDGLLEGTASDRPAPPRGTAQRRLTHTEKGLSEPRHWLRSSPDGSRIAFLMHDEKGVAQLWTVSPHGGRPCQVTHGKVGMESAFTWSPSGQSIALVIDGAVSVVDAETGQQRAIAPKGVSPIRSEASVFSPDGNHVAYMRAVNGFNQIFVAQVNG